MTVLKALGNGINLTATESQPTHAAILSNKKDVPGSRANARAEPAMMFSVLFNAEEENCRPCYLTTAILQFRTALPQSCWASR